MISNISIKELLKIIHKINIIDIRSIENYNRNHIPNAKNIPWETLIIYPEKYLNRNEVYYLYCQKGERTKTVANILSNKGYKIVNIIGGYEEWLLTK